MNGLIGLIKAIRASGYRATQVRDALCEMIKNEIGPITISAYVSDKDSRAATKEGDAGKAKVFASSRDEYVEQSGIRVVRFVACMNTDVGLSDKVLCTKQELKDLLETFYFEVATIDFRCHEADGVLSFQGTIEKKKESK